MFDLYSQEKCHLAHRRDRSKKNCTQLFAFPTSAVKSIWQFPLESCSQFNNMIINKITYEHKQVIFIRKSASKISPSSYV